MSYKALTSNTIYVNSVNDLPAPVSGVRTLATGTTYYFGALITDSNALKIPNGANVSLIGLDNQRSGFVYTGTGNGLQGTDCTIYCNNMYLSTSGGTGTMLSFSNAGLTTNLTFINCNFNTIYKMGSVSGFVMQVFENCIFANISNTGLTINAAILNYVSNTMYGNTTAPLIYNGVSNGLINGNMFQCSVADVCIKFTSNFGTYVEISNNYYNGYSYGGSAFTNIKSMAKGILFLDNIAYTSAIQSNLCPYANAWGTGADITTVTSATPSNFFTALVNWTNTGSSSHFLVTSGATNGNKIACNNVPYYGQVLVTYTADIRLATTGSAVDCWFGINRNTPAGGVATPSSVYSKVQLPASSSNYVSVSITGLEQFTASYFYNFVVRCSADVVVNNLTATVIRLS